MAVEVTTGYRATGTVVGVATWWSTPDGNGRSDLSRGFVVRLDEQHQGYITGTGGYVSCVPVHEDLVWPIGVRERGW